jgi:hypothetical protein
MWRSLKEGKPGGTGFLWMSKRDPAASTRSGEVVSEDTWPNLWAQLAAVSPELSKPARYSSCRRSDFCHRLAENVGAPGTCRSP